MPILKGQVASSPIFVSFFSFIKDYSSVLFLAQTIYTLLKRSPLKWTFLRFWSARLKFCQIPYANFETTTHFLSKLCISFQLHERLFLCSFLTQTIYTLLKRSLFKWKFLRFWSVRVKFSRIPYGNFETASCFLSNFWIFLQFYKRLFLCTLFSSNNIYFAQKEPIKMNIFEILECSAQILSNSLCQFWNDNSLPLKIMYLFSASWKIIPLQFFNSNNIYFAQKELVKMKIFEILECLGEILSNSLC